MSAEKKMLLDIIAGAIATGTGVASTLDSIEQVGRIILLLFSIISVCFLIVINIDKAAKTTTVKKIKNFFKW